MKAEQAEVLNITQQVLRTMLAAIGALNPAAMPTVALALHAASGLEDLHPLSRTMLADLADGIDALTREGQPEH